MFHPFVTLALLAFAPVRPREPQLLIGAGKAPQIAVDVGGTVRLIFARGDTIFVATSSDQGKNFGTSVVVGVVPRLIAGNTSGPVIASSRNRSLVGAPDRSGDFHLFQLEHVTGKWTPATRTLNDAPKSGPEALMTLSADANDNFYAVWLDTRLEKSNQVFFSRIGVAAGNLTISPNRRINSAVTGNSCECCRPSVIVRDKRVVVMFRNEMNGFRDMYLTESTDEGKTFSDAKKLGAGSWKLDACPVDGGAIGFLPSGEVQSVWRREAALYTARPGQAEIMIAPNARSPMLSTDSKSTFLIWQEGANVRFSRDAGKNVETIGEGRLPQVLALRDGVALTAWEQVGKVYARRME